MATTTRAGVVLLATGTMSWAISGEFDRRLATVINLLLQVCGVTLLAMNNWSLPSLVGCALFGLAVGNVISLPPLIAQAELDRADVL